MNILCRFLSTGQVQVTSAWRTCADKDSVEAFVKQLLHAVDPDSAAKHHTGVNDVADFFIDDLFGKSEAGNLATNHAAGPGVLIEDGHFIAERHEIAGDGQRCGSGADAGDAFIMGLRWRLRQTPANVAFTVRRDPFETADGDRLGLFLIVVLDAPAAAGRVRCRQP